MTDSDATEPEQTAQVVNDSQKEQMVRYLYWGASVCLFLFGLFAAVSFYTSMLEVIDIWIAADFEPVFRMLLNLSVVLITLLGLSVLIRRLDIPIGGSEG